MEETIWDVLYDHCSENSGYTPLEGWEALNVLLQDMPLSSRIKSSPQHVLSAVSMKSKASPQALKQESN